MYMQNHYGLSMEDIQAISQAIGIEKRNLYTQKLEDISKIYKIDIRELNVSATAEESVASSELIK